jgi:hypothetical protein
LSDLQVTSIIRSSWHVKFSLNPRTDNGRKWLFAVGVLIGAALASVGTAIVTPALPAAIIIAGTILGSVAGAAAIVAAPVVAPTPMAVDVAEPAGDVRVEIDLAPAA